jgi:tetratricopeptide (TPR) repeat protein
LAHLKRLIVEVHRRSLWQVLAVYLGAAWVVMEVVDHVIEQYLLPEWVYGAAIVLLAIGLPIVLATAFVREEPVAPSPVEPGLRDPTLLGDAPAEETRPGDGDGSGGPPALQRILTWPKAILGGVLAFTALALVSAFIVVRGLPRVAEASGSAGDAFEERAWIVIPEFRFSGTDAEVALAAQTALTLDLQQSQYVNVFGRRELGPVLRRMGRPDTLSLDEELALEVAEREGLAGVLAGSVSRLGSDYVLGARVLEPGTGREIIVVKTVAREERLLDGVQRLSRELRSRLGEAGEEIGQSKPLPEVTTRSLDALKKFGRARHANEVLGNPNRAAEFAEEAIRSDSSFASAYLMAATAHSNAGRIATAREFAARFYELRDRLPDRERLMGEAFYHYLVPFDPRRTVETYELLVSQFADEGRAWNNIGVMSGVFLGDYERSYESYRRGLELNPSPLSLDNSISLALYTGRDAAADSLIRRAWSEGHRLIALEGEFERAFLDGDWEDVEAFCDSLLAPPSGEAAWAETRRTCGSTDIARGRVRRAVDRLEPAIVTHERAGQYLGLGSIAHLEVMAAAMRGDRDAARSRLVAWLERLPADSIGEPDRFVLRTELLVIAGLLESEDLIERIRRSYPGDTYQDSTHWLRRYGDGISDGAVSLARGRPEVALEHVRSATATGYRPFYWVTFTELLYGLAFDALGQTDSAVAHFEVAADLRNVGLASFSQGRPHLPMVLRRLAELEEARSRPDAALRYYRRLLELWSNADPELREEVAAVRRAVARLSEMETG